jgi:hypothetical protein
MARDPNRDKIEGFSFDQDRLWKVTGPESSGYVTDYNWEITGVTPEIRNDDLRYGGNWYYWSDELRKRGYTVDVVEDRL